MHVDVGGGGARPEGAGAGADVDGQAGLDAKGAAADHDVGLAVLQHVARRESHGQQQRDRFLGRAESAGSSEVDAQLVRAIELGEQVLLAVLVDVGPGHVDRARDAREQLRRQEAAVAVAQRDRQRVGREQGGRDVGHTVAVGVAGGQRARRSGADLGSRGHEEAALAVAAGHAEEPARVGQPRRDGHVAASVEVEVSDSRTPTATDCGQRPRRESARAVAQRPHEATIDERGHVEQPVAVEVADAEPLVVARGALGQEHLGLGREHARDQLEAHAERAVGKRAEHVRSPVGVDIRRADILERALLGQRDDRREAAEAVARKDAQLVLSACDEVDAIVAGDLGRGEALGAGEPRPALDDDGGLQVTRAIAREEGHGRCVHRADRDVGRAVGVHVGSHDELRQPRTRGGAGLGREQSTLAVAQQDRDVAVGEVVLGACDVDRAIEIEVGARERAQVQGHADHLHGPWLAVGHPLLDGDGKMLLLAHDLLGQAITVEVDGEDFVSARGRSQGANVPASDGRLLGSRVDHEGDSEDSGTQSKAHGDLRRRNCGATRDRRDGRDARSRVGVRAGAGRRISRSHDGVATR
jgi:hypothetical protein